ncbi:hypothetical protein H6504_04510 [Candidatus Woesearchaeota archaeon]|nr:hypothetical protein [Candidatus Woesearchaeota archaeon]
MNRLEKIAIIGSVAALAACSSTPQRDTTNAVSGPMPKVFDLQLETGKGAVYNGVKVGAQDAGNVLVLDLGVHYNEPKEEDPEYGRIDKVTIKGPDGYITDTSRLGALNSTVGKQVTPLSSLQEAMAFKPGTTSVYTLALGENGPGFKGYGCDSFRVEWAPSTGLAGKATIFGEDETITQTYGADGNLLDSKVSGAVEDRPICEKAYKQQLGIRW